MSQTAVLACHPWTGCDAVHRVEVRLQRMPGALLALTFSLQGHLSRLRIPPWRAPRPADRLWEHTCFEAFVALDDDCAYHEFNFAPSGEWAVYAFQRYREAVPPDGNQVGPGITVQSGADHLLLDAGIHLERLSARHAIERIRLGLSAVVEDESGGLSHWALRHPLKIPDFHHPDAFALHLEPPATVAGHGSNEG
jgi:hypothetical protein